MVVVIEFESEGTAELDVALAHPWSQDVLPSSANTDGAAARRREEIKHKKYSHETLPGGYSPSLIPLVMEHFGRWGQEASDYLSVLARTGSTGKLPVGAARCRLKVGKQPILLVVLGTSRYSRPSHIRPPLGKTQRSRGRMSEKNG